MELSILKTLATALNVALPATTDRAALCMDSEKVLQRSEELHIIGMGTEKPFVVHKRCQTSCALRLGPSCKINSPVKSRLIEFFEA